MDVELPPDDQPATGPQGVPVVLPVREGSPGRAYGTAAEGHPFRPAAFRPGFVSGTRYAIIGGTKKAVNDRDDAELTTWRDMHERTRRRYEHHRAGT